MKQVPSSTTSSRRGSIATWLSNSGCPAPSTSGFCRCARARSLLPSYWQDGMKPQHGAGSQDPISQLYYEPSEQLWQVMAPLCLSFLICSYTDGPMENTGDPLLNSALHEEATKVAHRSAASHAEGWGGGGFTAQLHIPDGPWSHLSINPLPPPDL